MSAPLQEDAVGRVVDYVLLAGLAADASMAPPDQGAAPASLSSPLSLSPSLLGSPRSLSLCVPAHIHPLERVYPTAIRWRYPATDHADTPLAEMIDAVRKHGR